MAKLTDEYIRKAFYRQFYALSPERRLGVIEGLQAVHECQPEQAQLPLAEVETNDDASNE